MRKVATILAVTLVASCSQSFAASTPARFYFGTGPHKPFASAVRIGEEVYVSGAIGADANGNVPSDFSAQVRNAMDAVSAELNLAGASMDDVYKCDVALTDMKNWAAFNAVYVRYFKAARLPVRMAAGVTSLVKASAVEVECDAHVSSN